MTIQPNSQNINYLKILLLSLIVGVLAGTASAFFLFSLDKVTTFREGHQWAIWLLPLAGLGIGIWYHYYGKEVVKGNNLIIEEYSNPQKRVPFKMMPMILFCTIATHLFGGSAGREGTAVQMGGSIADQFTSFFHLNNQERKLILILGISAGFASVFGTPWAGAIFALEVLWVGRFAIQAILPSILAAFIAHHTCLFFKISHTNYTKFILPEFQINFILWSIIAGIIFGLTAFLFTKSILFFEKQFKEKVLYPPLRPFIGGILIALAVYLMQSTKYIGLGIPTIEEAFKTELPPYDFLLKLVFTAYTLGAGFKGGEVTPLFFIGATLGNTLSFFIPLPLVLLAGIGLAAIFAGATNTPLACTILAIELFGVDCAVYAGFACIVAYLCSGSIGIYSSQPKSSPKYLLYKKIFKQKQTS